MQVNELSPDLQAKPEAQRVGESEMIQAAIAGDERAFASLVERYRPLVQQSCRLSLGPQAAMDLEDCVQAVFLLLHRKLPQLKGQVVLSSWLYRTARFTCMDLQKKHIRRTRREQEALSRMHDDEQEDPEQQERQRALHKALGSLAPTDQDLILERYIQEVPLSDMAALRGVKGATLRKRLERAMSRLRSKLHASYASAGPVLMISWLQELCPLGEWNLNPGSFTVGSSALGLAGEILSSKLLAKTVAASVAASIIGATSAGVLFQLRASGKEQPSVAVQQVEAYQELGLLESGAPSILPITSTLSFLPADTESGRREQIRHLRSKLQFLQNEIVEMDFIVERSGRLQLTWYEKESLFNDSLESEDGEERVREQISEFATYTSLTRWEVLGTDHYLRYLQLQEDVQVLFSRIRYLENLQEND